MLNSLSFAVETLKKHKIEIPVEDVPELVPDNSPDECIDLSMEGGTLKLDTDVKVSKTSIGMEALGQQQEKKYPSAVTMGEDGVYHIYLTGSCNQSYDVIFQILMQACEDDRFMIELLNPSLPDDKVYSLASCIESCLGHVTVNTSFVYSIFELMIVVSADVVNLSRGFTTITPVKNFAFGDTGDIVNRADSLKRYNDYVSKTFLDLGIVTAEEIGKMDIEGKFLLKSNLELQEILSK